jgi:ABC-2 type transport system ATP-binding protein
MMVAVERHPEAQPSAASSPALAIEGVSHHYGPRQALADVSLSIPPATFVVLLGLNAAGKSTLFSLVTRLFATQRGQIRIFGHDIARAPGAALRLLGVVFQLRTLDLDLSVMQNLTYHAALHGIGRRTALERANDLLARIELADRAKDKIRNLSGGQMRRVEIARALLHRPRLLLLDEPTVGLDIKARADILSHVRSLVADEGVSVLWAPTLLTRCRKPTPSPCCTAGAFSRTVQSREWSQAHTRRTKDIGSAFARLIERKAIGPRDKPA